MDHKIILKVHLSSTGGTDKNLGMQEEEEDVGVSWMSLRKREDTGN